MVVELSAGDLVRLDRAKLISPYAFQESIAPAGNAATVAAIAREAKRRNRSSAAEPSVERDQQHLRARRRQAERAMQPGRTARPGASKKMEISKWYGVMVTSGSVNARRREERDQRRSPTLENQSRPDEEQRRDVDEVPLDEAVTPERSRRKRPWPRRRGQTRRASRRQVM